MAVLTLIDYAADPDPLIAGVAKVLRGNKLMDVMPFVTIGGMATKVIHEAGMVSGAAWRQMGASHSSVKSVTYKEKQEQVYSFGNEISVDKMLMRDTSSMIVNPMTYWTDMTVKGMGRDFVNKVVNGLPTDLNNPVGLWYRVSNDLGSSQRITAAADGGSGGLDISSDAASLSTNINTLMDKLDQLIYAVNDSVDAEGRGVYLLMNDTTLMRLQSCLRQSGLNMTTTDTYGRVWMHYKGAMFLDVGFAADETDTSTGTRIIGNVETLAGTALTTGTGTSIYAVKMGSEYFTGIQEYSMEVTPPELDPVHKMTYYSVVDWPVGIALTHPRSIARLYGVVAA